MAQQYWWIYVVCGSILIIVPSGFTQLLGVICITVGTVKGCSDPIEKEDEEEEGEGEGEGEGDNISLSEIIVVEENDEKKLIMKKKGDSTLSDAGSAIGDAGSASDGGESDHGDVENKSGSESGSESGNESESESDVGD